MKLVSFRVKNFRSVDDSGSIAVKDKTALVGRNESGKTNLLLALRSLNPPEGRTALSFAKDFPRHRAKSEFREDLTVVETTWELSESEQAEVSSILPRAQGVSVVEIGRYYEPACWVRFSSMPPLEIPEDSASAAADTLVRSIQRAKATAAHVGIQAAAGAVQAAASTGTHLDPQEWAEAIRTALQALRQQLGDTELSGAGGDALATLTQLSGDIVNDADAAQEARGWVVDRLPVFIYLDDYPMIEGHQHVGDYLARTHANKPAPGDEYFSKLLKVADLNAEELARLLHEDHEERQLLTNRAGAVVTKKIRDLWTDRELTVRFHLDADHFDTLVSDPTAAYPVEVNLNERSRGFRWFFSFYIAFTADTKDGPAEGAILLLDEPGLHLHVLSQRDLLKHFDADFENQILYTTHLPFMIPTDHLERVRTVTIDPETGSVVSNDPVGDAETVFPILHALGVEITQSLFIGEWNLVVEGVTDYWYLSTISDYIEETGGRGLSSKLTITPSGTSSKVPYMVTLLTSHRLSAIVLLDDEPKARVIATDMIKKKLIREKRVLYVSEAFDAPRPSADIEDLLDPDVYSQLVQETYQVELQGKTLSLDTKIPRVVKRFEKAFGDLGLPFHHTRPARRFLDGMASEPENMLPSSSRERFQQLFDAVGTCLTKIEKNKSDPYH